MASVHIDEVEIITDILYAIDAIMKSTYGDAIPLTYKHLSRRSKLINAVHALLIRRIIDEYMGLSECHISDRWYKRSCVEEKIKKFRESLGL